MSGSNEAVCITENENDHESRTATHGGETVMAPSQNENKITEYNNEPKWTNTENAAATSTFLKDVIIGKKVKEVPWKSRVEKYVIYRWLFVLLRKNVKKQKHSPLQTQIQKRNTVWVQCGRLKCRRNKKKTKKEPKDKRNDDDDDYRINYVPGRKNKFVIIWLSLVATMWFLTAMSLFVILISDFLTSLFEAPGILLQTFVYGLFILCYFWFTCLPIPRSLPLSIVLVILTFISVTCILAIISISFQTEILFNTLLITMFITLFCLLLSITRCNLRSILLYLYCIILAFLLTTLTIIFTMLISGRYYKTKNMVALNAAVIIQVVALVMELQSILNGTTIAKLDRRDHCLGIFLLYTSVITFIIYSATYLGLYKELKGN